MDAREAGREHWLTTPWAGLRELLPSGLPEAADAPPESDVAAVTVADGGDVMVRVPGTIRSRHVYRQLPLRLAPDQLFLRQAVVLRLQEAQRLLPPGLELCLLDCWRSVPFQEELLQGYQRALGRDLDGYVSDPGSTRLVPPHTTGGAVDLTLAAQGAPLALGTDFDEFTPVAHLRSLEDLGAAAGPELRLARDLRRVLSRAMVGAGFAPFPREWWHWSYGDQRWAAFVGAERTEYAPTDSVPTSSVPVVNE